MDNGKKSRKFYSYDEAVELTGHGRYNHLLLAACSIISNAVALDMFGFGVIVAAASCDLQLGMTETGILASAPFAGLLFAFPWGYYADIQGRRRALLLSTSVGFVLGALSSLSPSWQVMLALKLMGCSFSSAAFTLTITYLGECVGSKHRSQYLFIMNSVNLASEAVSFILAYFLLPLNFIVPIPLLDITFRPWRLLTLLMAVPLGIGTLMITFLHESPKFLANKGENEKALSVLTNIYKVNCGKEDYPVKYLTDHSNQEAQSEVQEDCKTRSGFSFWTSIVQQTVPIFRPPLLWRTVQLFYLLIICASTNNVFVMWFPTMVNSFFNSLSEGNYHKSFCQRVISNITAVTNDAEYTFCDDTISLNTIYSGILYGLFFMFFNLILSRLASFKRLVLIFILILSAISGILVDVLRMPILSMILFTLLQGTSIGIGITASYFVDLYPTSYRGLVTSLGMMMARLSSFAGVNLIGAVIVEHCSWTFYGWSIFVLSGVITAFILPLDGKTSR